MESDEHGFLGLRSLSLMAHCGVESLGLGLIFKVLGLLGHNGPLEISYFRLRIYWAFDKAHLRSWAQFRKLGHW